MQTTQVDQEAVALARCYALLLQKARERRARLAAETAVSDEEEASELITPKSPQTTQQKKDRPLI